MKFVYDTLPHQFAVRKSAVMVHEGDFISHTESGASVAHEGALAPCKAWRFVKKSS
ncbi:MAG TPA: hypothetical protein VF427_13335 [Noviherbaspirillum sp.]